jgi:hypothetical protein
MAIKILFCIFICTSCGKEINIKNKLEDVNALSSKEVNYQKSGTLLKGSPNQITYQSQPYTVSAFSSKAALDFISALPLGSKTSVVFTGGINKKEMVIESIKKQ